VSWYLISSRLNAIIKIIDPMKAGRIEIPLLFYIAAVLTTCFAGGFIEKQGVNTAAGLI
jgi:hypothetical protein